MSSALDVAEPGAAATRQSRPSMTLRSQRPPALSRRTPARAGRAARAAPSVVVRLEHRQGISRQPGPAARRRGRVLRAALDRAAADPVGDRAVERDPSRSFSPRSAATSNGSCRGSRRRSSPSSRISSAARQRRLAAVRDDGVLQLARLHRARERDVGDLPAPRRREEAALHLLGADPVRLHPVARRRPAAGDARRRQPAGGRQGKRRLPRPHLVAATGCRRPALSARVGGRDVRADLGLSGHALGATAGGATR